MLFLDDDLHFWKITSQLSDRPCVVVLWDTPRRSLGTCRQHRSKDLDWPAASQQPWIANAELLGDLGKPAGACAHKRARRPLSATTASPSLPRRSLSQLAFLMLQKLSHGADLVCK